MGVDYELLKQEKPERYLICINTACLLKVALVVGKSTPRALPLVGRKVRDRFVIILFRVDTSASQNISNSS